MRKVWIMLIISVWFVTNQAAMAQQVLQTVRGTVVDRVSQFPLPGAVVTLLGSEPLNITATDANGKFKLTNVPIGKQSIKVTYIGYQESVLRNLTVNAGKELVLTVQMEESMQTFKEVVIEDKVEKNKPLNTMSTVSTRTFSVEETQKFAAAVNDPARMASSFAGVVQGNDGNNVISIRGNSPNGLLWRMEGVEIPNPNHFSAVGTSGGGISILSAQLLGNSDFSTGAFAAEYGNALSGVFDLKLRKGNNQKREYTIQAGLLGIDVAAEGPFRKGYEGSYLINYRYSTLNLLAKVGVPLGNSITNFQDLSYNINLPTSHAGTFGLFGFAGLSYQKRQASTDTAEWSKDDFNRIENYYGANTIASGLSHTVLFKNQSYLKTVLMFSGTENQDLVKIMEYDLKTLTPLYDNSYLQNKFTLSSVYTKKLSARSNIRSGIILNRLGYGLTSKEQNVLKKMVTLVEEEGSTQTAQAFTQWNYKVSERLTSNIGLHYLQLFLNNTHSVEPRASLKYQYNPFHSFTVGYGLHGQAQPIGVYFARQYQADGSWLQPNKNLGISKAHHLVVGYDFNLNSFTHIKTEVYYQYLFDVPVEDNKASTYSTLNLIDGYSAVQLANKGKGENKGVELTLERFLHKNFYYLLSASLFDSRYKAANGNWYDTRFNTKYAVSLTAGKEWMLSERYKNRVIGCNLKTVFVGGWRVTPVDLEESRNQQKTVVDPSRIFTEKNPDYFRMDLRVSVKRNYARITTTLALDIQNSTNRKNVGGQYYDPNSATVKYWYQTPLIPILSYRVEF